MFIIFLNSFDFEVRFSRLNKKIFIEFLTIYTQILNLKEVIFNKFFSATIMIF